MPGDVVDLRRANDVAAGETPQILERIKDEIVALAVWRRSLPRDLTDGVDRAAVEALPRARFFAPVADVGAALEAACAGLPESVRDALVEDASALAGRFAAVMGASGLHVRLERIETNACRKFHRDVVPARLLCSYRGPATEWGYAAAGETPEVIHRLERGDVAMVKGSEWPGGRPSTLLHRSPPIEGEGVARLLLVVDLAEAL